MADDEQRDLDPTERTGGTVPGAEEAREKGPWAAKARDGVVPADLGGSDADAETLPDDPQLGGAVTGRTTGSDEPATESGVDLSAGDDADATTDGGAEKPDDGAPSLRDAASGPRQSDIESAE